MANLAAKPKIVVLGGGFGGLESAFYLNMQLHDRADLTLISDADRFLFKPNTIYVPFGLDPEELMFGIETPARSDGIQFVKARAQEIDPDRRLVFADGQQYPFDFLVVATGATMRPEEIPGMKEHAITIWTPAEMMRLRHAFEALRDDARSGARRKVLFLVPPNNKCSGPLYEMVMMLDTWLHRQQVREQVEITWSTYEKGYIQAFGPRLNELVTEEFARRGVEGHKEFVVSEITEESVLYRSGERLPYDVLVSFPPYAASTAFPGLPTDDRGFISTELETRQVKGHPEIYAVGDAADFPVKQAFLAFLQADAAAEQVSACVLGRIPEHTFVPTSMCVMEQFDKATFAQVPLHLTGIPDRPVEVDPLALDQYKVGSSKIWRAGKMALGYYLPWRFRNGNPFHAGAPWKGMEAGLKVMSRVLAH